MSLAHSKSISNGIEKSQGHVHNKESVLICEGLNFLYEASIMRNNELSIHTKVELACNRATLGN